MKVFYLYIAIAVILLAVMLGGSSKREFRSVGELFLPEFAKNKQARILFVGDMQFDRYIRQVSEKKGGDYIFSCIKDFLDDYDLVVGNLEGPITDNPSVSAGSEVGSPQNFVFTFPPSTAKLLRKNNIKLVSLANNHMLNFSRDGLLQTKKYLEEAGVEYFGDPDAVENDKVAQMNIGGIAVSFVNWSDWNSDNTDITALQIKKEADLGRKVFVYAHWGEEYVPPPERVKKLARSFVDAGAEMIIGSHPHVVQESEIYPSISSGQAGKFIYYSLGNFIFDQYWDKSVSTGLVLELNVRRTSNNSQITVTEHRVSMQKDGRTCLAE